MIPTEYSIRDLLKYQISNNYFKRVDIIIKYMVLSDNDRGTILYLKMYKNLFNYSNDRVQKRLNVFKKMALDAINNNFDTKKHPILLTNKFEIWNGAHRLACAIYYNYLNIFAHKTHKNFKRGCDIGYNALNFFNKDECALIEKNTKKIFNQFKI